MSSEDIIEGGGRELPPFVRFFRRRPPAAAAAGVALIAAFAAGFAAGSRHGAVPAAGSAGRTAAAAADTTPLIETAAWCSDQTASGLQLGTQVTNTSGAAVTLRRAQAVLPLGGLAPVAQAWAPCGALPGPSGVPENRLPPGASGWFTITFRVGVRCPGAMPVQFRLSYEQAGRTRTVALAGFSDLTQVPYPGCPAG